MEFDETTRCAFGIIGDEIFKLIWASEPQYLSAHVGIRNVVNEEGRIQVAIMVDSQTDKKDIPNVWSEIKKEIDRLVGLQGHDLSDYYQVLLDELIGKNYTEMVEFEEIPGYGSPHGRIEYSKPQYRDLFMDANFDLLLFIIRISKGKNAEDLAKLARHYFINLLSNFNFPMDNIEALISASLEEISDGRCPLDIYHGPIDFSQFTNKLEYLVQRFRGQKMDPAAKENLLSVYRLFQGDWVDAENLLRTTFPETYERYKPRLDARRAEVFKTTSS